MHQILGILCRQGTNPGPNEESGCRPEGTPADDKIPGTYLLGVSWVLPMFHASPLTDLTKKGQLEKVIWSSEGEQAFQELKSVLISSPVLYALNFGCPFTLQTDASDTGLVAIPRERRSGAPGRVHQQNPGMPP